MNNGIRVRQIIFEELMKKQLGDNEKILRDALLLQQAVIPLIGAGIPAWCYPTWTGLLKKVVGDIIS
ncbi:MAG: hypothetical protein NC543_04935 [bacterium]|nr:hypothetical protein [bacterium]MCM1374884.1 hypothetical protein [Muribaculum sp.]